MPAELKVYKITMYIDEKGRRIDKLVCGDAPKFVFYIPVQAITPQGPVNQVSPFETSDPKDIREAYGMWDDIAARNLDALNMSVKRIMPASRIIQ